MKGSLPIVLFFVLGVICGRAGVFPEELSRNDGSLVVLCALIFCVGVTIGGDTATLAKFRTLNPGLLLLPVASVAGNWADCRTGEWRYGFYDGMAIAEGDFWS